MATSPGNSGVNEVISLAFGAAGESHDAISLPTVMLPRRWFGEAKGVDLVEAIKYWFEQHGFSAERSYHDGMHGYTGLFRELGGWYRGILRPFAKPIRTNCSNAAGFVKHFHSWPCQSP
jgi:hypothetical protein